MESLNKTDLSNPDKAKTVITREFDDKGTGLSGGEQQKIAIARAFYKKCPYVMW